MENCEQEVPRHLVAPVVKHQDNPIALVDLGTGASEALRASWPTGRPQASAGVIDSACLLRMLGAGCLSGIRVHRQTVAFRDLTTRRSGNPSRSDALHAGRDTRTVFIGARWK